MDNQFKLGIEILQALKNAGYEAYFVGGAVRDYVRGTQIHDIDLATSATIAQMKEIFPKTIHVGMNHDTLIIRYKGKSFETTTFRRKYESEPLSLETDLKYRDFTMNAMAMDDTFQLIDPWHGQAHIKQKRIAAVGDATTRIGEDPLRILRAFRFMSETSFSIDKETMKALQANRHLLTDVAVERMLVEWEKILIGHDVNEVVQKIYTSQIHQYIPGFKNNPQLFAYLLNKMQWINELAEMVAYLHIRDGDISISQWVTEWKASNAVKQKANELVSFINMMSVQGMTSWVLYQINPVYIESFVRICQVLNMDEAISVELLHKKKTQLVIQHRDDLAFQPLDIVQLFPTYPKGRWIGASMKKIEYEVVMGKLENDYEKIKEWILCHPPEIN